MTNRDKQKVYELRAVVEQLRSAARGLSYAFPEQGGRLVELADEMAGEIEKLDPTLH